MNLISMERVSESCALDSKSLISDDGNADFSGIKLIECSNKMYCYSITYIWIELLVYHGMILRISTTSFFYIFQSDSDD